MKGRMVIIKGLGGSFLSLFIRVFFFFVHGRMVWGIVSL